MDDDGPMRSRTLFVWLAIATVMMVVLIAADWIGRM